MTLSLGGRIGGEIPQFRPFISGQIELGGIVTGTTIRTLDGDLPVEFLQPGDRVITRNSGAARLIAIERDMVLEKAVEFTPGAMGRDAPEASLILPASQPVLMRDWRAKVMFRQPQAVAPAGVLVDHGFILDRGEQELDLHRLIFERDQIVYAGGLELTSEPIRERVRRVA
ncbi:Hint domain-containing protein [Aestuariivita boseongensis]|uniref:Hint domain-containing protein n=1 Tax=Aestuariivita boseongensis TaxID=1470562 RepID=UPI000680E6A9|nr:Hint domain-containing protein [Aestuariivita boseongensis]